MTDISSLGKKGGGRYGILRGWSLWVGSLVAGWRGGREGRFGSTRHCGVGR